MDMNNQVKITDTQKLLDWIAVNEKEYYDTKDVFNALERAIESGVLAFDTPPVPTIKPGDTHECPKCGEKNCFDTPLAESTALRFVWCSFCNQFSYKEDWR